MRTTGISIYGFDPSSAIGRMLQPRTSIVSREHTRNAEPSWSFSLRKASRTTSQIMLSPLRLSAVK
jgi:hypothetical protein